VRRILRASLISAIANYRISPTGSRRTTATPATRRRQPAKPGQSSRKPPRKAASARRPSWLAWYGFSLLSPQASAEAPRISERGKAHPLTCSLATRSGAAVGQAREGAKRRRTAAQARRGLSRRAATGTGRVQDCAQVRPRGHVPPWRSQEVRAATLQPERLPIESCSACRGIKTGAIPPAG